MYKKAVTRGALEFPSIAGGAADGTAAAETPKSITITVEDDAGNLSTLAFAVEPDLTRTAPARPEGRPTPPYGNFIHFADGLAVSIPREALYEPVFYTQQIVDQKVAPRSDSIRPLTPVYRTGDGVLPLHAAMRLEITSDLPEAVRSRACLARVSPSGTLSYAGGRWSNGGVNGTSRDFGTFCVVADRVAPTVRASFAEGADLGGSSRVTLTASDNFSGIANFSGTIDGEWIIFERNASRGQFVHRFDVERLTPGTTHTLEFTCRDGAGNTTTLHRTFSK
jgi:hypothetical protein